MNECMHACALMPEIDLTDHLIILRFQFMQICRAIVLHETVLNCNQLL